MPKKHGLSFPFDAFGEMMDEFFDGAFNAFDSINAGSRVGRRSSGIRVEKQADLVTVEVDVPGASREDVRVRCGPGVLKVEWTPRGRATEEREMRIGRKADVSAITAKVENGVLTITIPAAASAQDEREVKVD